MRREQMTCFRQPIRARVSAVIAGGTDPYTEGSNKPEHAMLKDGAHAGLEVESSKNSGRYACWSITVPARPNAVSTAHLRVGIMMPEDSADRYDA